MKNKTVSLILSLAIILVGIGALSAGTVNAQVASYPAGCSSPIGFSTSSGVPCNGTSVATQLPVGCPTALGYSTTTGAPCDGTSFAIFYLAGCTSGFGYSTDGGQPCNGTTVATFPSTTTGVPPVTITTPGLPTTGEGGNAPINMLLLVTSGLVSIAGLTYLMTKKPQKSQLT